MSNNQLSKSDILSMVCGIAISIKTLDQRSLQSFKRGEAATLDGASKAIIGMSADDLAYLIDAITQMQECCMGAAISGSDTIKIMGKVFAMSERRMREASGEAMQ